MCRTFADFLLSAHMGRGIGEIMFKSLYSRVKQNFLKKYCKPFASHSSNLFVFNKYIVFSVKSYLEHPILIYLPILNLKGTTSIVCEKSIILQVVLLERVLDYKHLE